jgi:hypothetical protein
MTRKLIIERTVNAINQLPEDKAVEISDFAEFIIKRYEEQCITEGVQNLISNSQSFAFLAEEEEIYTVADLKKVYNGEG